MKASDPLRSKAGAAGADGIVQKPFRAGELERKVAEALTKRTMPALRLVSTRQTSNGVFK